MILQLFQRFAALVSIALLAFGGYLLWSWWDLREALEAGRTIAEDDVNWRLWAGLALVAWSLLGRTPVLWLLGRPGDDGERMKRLEGRPVETSTGACLQVQTTGPAEAPALIFVHGWAMDSTIWWEARRQLADRYQVITYDLAGLGRSIGPVDERYTLEGFADDLAAVIGEVCPRKKAVLVGHSIGGMILQTLARRHPEMLGRQVLGLVLENTSHTDPSQTTVLRRALGVMKPVLIPLMHLDIMLAPVVWLMNWQSYLSGSTHIAMRFGGFGTRPTRAQLDQVSRLATRNSPSVQARGNIAMMRWDATGDLHRLRAPSLVFIGGRDLVTIPQAGETIAGAAGDATPVRVREAGHMGPVELAGVYNEAIARFADEVFTRGAAWADRPPLNAWVEPRREAASWDTEAGEPRPAGRA